MSQLFAKAPGTRIAEVRDALKENVPEGLWFVLVMSRQGAHNLGSLSLNAFPLIDGPIDTTDKTLGVRLAAMPSGRLAWTVGPQQPFEGAATFLVASNGIDHQTMKLGATQNLKAGKVWFGEKAL